MDDWTIKSLPKTLASISFLVLLPMSGGYADAPSAQANVYDINPLRTPQPAVRTLIDLQDPLYLSGSYVNVIDSKYCNGCTHSYAVRDPNAGFIYNPGDPRLAEAMAYYQIDQYRNYIVTSVGIPLPALPLTIDAHTVVNGSDITGAAYSPPSIFGGTWPGSIAVGDKNRIDTNGDWIPDTDVTNIEMALNADVLVHEYGHAITDYLRFGNRSYSALPKFMQEGWADYLMCSRLNSQLVGDWTDRNGFRGYRRTLAGGIAQLDFWPTTNFRAADGISDTDYNTARIYYNSMVWSSSLWELRERISRLAGSNGVANYPAGSILADRLVLTAIPLFNVSGQSDSNPVAAVTQGILSLKQALAQLQANPSYATVYQNVTSTDIDLAFSSRFPKSYGTVQVVSSDERENAWTYETGRKEVAVAVIDTGLALTNFATGKSTSLSFGSEDKNLNGVLDTGEDTNGNGILDRGNIAYGWDFVNGTAAPADSVGFGGSHGTIVAQTLAAANTASGVGMVWNTSLWILRMNSSDGSVPFSYSSQRGGEAFRYAVDNHADVVNYSRGNISESGTFVPADAVHMPTFYAIQEGNQVNYGLGKDTIVVAAASDGGLDDDVNPIYPASYPLPNVISVTSCDGTKDIGKHNVDLCGADGGDTSYAAPEVSGALALLLSKQKDRQEAHPGYRSLTTGEIKYLLMMSTDHVPAFEGKTVSEGRLNVRRLLEYYESDADGDGYGDKIEALFGTTPNDPNSHPDMNGDDDGDGLSNGLELAYGTIPIPVSPGVNYSGRLYPIYLNANGTIKNGISAQDSDGDGISDYAEVYATNGYYTDPANPDTNANGIADGQDSIPSLFKVTVSNTLALNKPTTASDTFISWWPAANATDGNSSSYWSSTNSAGPHWLTVDLGAVARVHATRFLFDTQYSIAANYTLQFSLDGNFANPATREVSVTGNTLRDRTDTFAAPIRARYVRFLITAPSAAGNYFHVNELEVHGEMPTNIAIGKTATASDDFYGIWKAPNAIDGNISTFWQTAAGVSSPHWLQIDLGTSSSISSIVTHYDTQYNFASDYTLQFSNTGDFSATGLNAPYVVHVTNNTSRDPVNTFYSPVKARYVRLLMNSPISGVFRVKEFEINGVTP